MAAAASLFSTLLLLSAAMLLPCSATFSRTLSKSEVAEMKKMKKEKMSHLHFYFHDVVSGRTPSAIRVAEAPATNTSRTGFGAVVMMDDALTVGPSRSSKLVGWAQGIYASASQTELSFLMALNYVFVEGKYNGSTLSILGKNSALTEVREMPVVGGSGLFRFARGYAQARTHWIDYKSGDAVVEYNVYVLHY